MRVCQFRHCGTAPSLGQANGAGKCRAEAVFVDSQVRRGLSIRAPDYAERRGVPGRVSDTV